MKADTNNLVTFFFIGPNDEDEIATKEHTTYDPPTLIMPNAVEGGPANPIPADGSTITNLNLSELCWENYAINRAKLWFGAADANDIDYQTKLTPIATLDITSEGQTTCSPIPGEYLPLNVPATYTWAVEGYAYPPEDPNHYGEPNMLFATMVWKFYTSAVPIVKSDPADQYKFAGETATFTVTFESLTNLTGVTWYLDSTAVNPADPDVNITTTALGNKQYSSTLTSSNAALADDGGYTCVAQNSGGKSDPTSVAYLVIKRKLAHWAFDDNANDATGVYTGTAFGEPVYTAGKLGQALVFDGVDDYVKLPEGFANFRAGLTFTVWANPSAANSWARFFDFGNGEGVNNVFVTRNGTTTNLTLNTYNGTVTANTVLVLNEWQFFAVTMTEAGDVTIYKNGLSVQTGTLGVPTAITRTSNFIGESNWATDILYAGMMDEMQIYNYALDADTLATMYSDIAGTYCRNRPELDWSGNCVVDLADFVQWANVWLECGLWPASACNEL
ncbi:MAG: LamG-like jellyroll fold domain-containing protein [Anaerohalosphaeraceae bacterium]